MNCTDWFSASCYIESWASAFTRGVGKGVSESVNFDASAAASKTFQVINDFLRNIDTAKMGENFGKLFDKGWDGLDVSGRSQTVGSDIKDAMNGFTLEVGDGFAKSFANMANGIRDEFIYKQLPYVLG